MKRNKIIFFTTVVLSVFFAQVSLSQLHPTWELLSDVRFEIGYSEELDERVEYPIFSKKLLGYHGKRIEISGYVLPMMTEDGGFIISKYTYADCFFCGGGGPESVIEVYFEGKAPKLKADQFVFIEGELELNTFDYYHLNYIFRDSQLLKK